MDSLKGLFELLIIKGLFEGIIKGLFEGIIWITNY